MQKSFPPKKKYELDNSFSKEKGSLSPFRIKRIKYVLNCNYSRVYNIFCVLLRVQVYVSFFKGTL